MRPVSQWLTVGLAAVLTIAILGVDWLLWVHLGREYTFSHVASWVFREHPVLAATALFWGGVVVGHWLPS